MKNKSILVVLGLFVALANAPVKAGVAKNIAGMFAVQAVAFGGLAMYEVNHIPQKNKQSSALNVFGSLVRGQEAKTGIQLNIFTRTIAAAVLLRRYIKTVGWN